MFDKILFSFPQGEDWRYDIYHISMNGNDTTTCGHSADTACRTLEYILHVYNGRLYSSELGLQIITSTSLVINQSLMVRFMLQISIGKNHQAKHLE